MNYRERLVEYLHATIDAEFDPDRDPLAQALDSVSLLQLITFIDQELGVSLDLSTLTLDAFASVDSVVRTLVGLEASDEREAEAQQA